MDFESKNVEKSGYVILKDGHTLFPRDVIKLLERLAYLEKSEKARHMWLTGDTDWPERGL